MGQISSLTSIIQGYRNQLKTLESALPDNPSAEQLANLKITQTPIYAAINTSEQQLRSLNENIKSGKIASSNSVKGQNNGINTTRVYEENEKVVNTIYLTTVAKGNTNFTATQSSQLWSIASQCPLEGGSAVFKARSLYILIDAIAVFNDDDICSAAGLVLLQRPDQEITTNKKHEVAIADNITSSLMQWSVVPNPASTQVTVTYQAEDIQAKSVHLYDLAGQKVNEINFVQNVYSTRLDVTNLSSGIYWIELVLFDGTTKIQKISIIK